MDEPFADTGSSAGSPPRAAKSLLRDVLIGGALGIVLATCGALLVCLVGLISPAGGNNPIALGLKETMIIVGLLVVVTCGAVAGYFVGDTVGAVSGGVAAYLIPFMVYGMRIQRTIGWRVWISSWNKHKERRSEFGAKP